MPYGYTNTCLQICDAQVKRDKCIVELLGIMNDAYAFVDEAKDVHEKHKVIFERLAQQTIECGYFISSYSMDLQFGMHYHIALIHH
jgi:hypothetical protein